MATASKKVYLAPSALISFIDRAHVKHEESSAYFRYFAQEQYQLFTDHICIITAYETIYTAISPSLAKDFMRTLSLTNINILYPDESDAKAALKALVSYQNTELTYPASVMAVLANRRGISQIFTYEYLQPLFGLITFYLPL